VDQVAYDTAYAWMSGAIDITWLLWGIVGPLIFLRLVLKFLGWSKRQTRGVDYEGLSEQVSETYNTELMGRVDRWRR